MQLRRNLRRGYPKRRWSWWVSPVLRPFPPEVVTLGLTKLPFDHEQELEISLRSVLAEYDQVLDIWRHTDHHAGWFIGLGVAVLDLTPFPGEKPHASRRHEIPLSDEGIFRATWKAMPSFYIRTDMLACIVPLDLALNTGIVGKKNLNARCLHERRSQSRKKPRVSEVTGVISKSTLKSVVVKIRRVQTILVTRHHKESALAASPLSYSCRLWAVKYTLHHTVTS